MDKRLSKKVGPFPLWLWLVAGAAGLYLWWQSQSPASQKAASAAAPMAQAAPAAPQSQAAKIGGNAPRVGRARRTTSKSRSIILRY